MSLKKPNFFRVEVAAVEPRRDCGVLIGDGENAWTYWRQGRPLFGSSSKEAWANYNDRVHDSYLLKPATRGRFSISHDDRFQWKPPQGWKRWWPEDRANQLLKPGRTAPDFDLATPKGGKIRLSDFRGKTVWLYIWRVGCPPCRKGLVELDEIQRTHENKGLVILGLNTLDDKQIALELLRKKSVTFPMILDASDAAQRLSMEDYGGSTVPVNYIIDKDQVVVDAWYGHNNSRGLAAVEEASR